MTDKSGPAQRQSPSTDAVADIMIRDMFAPHELPLDEELTGKYQALAGKIIAALAPQPAVEPTEQFCTESLSKPGLGADGDDRARIVLSRSSAPSPALDPVTVEALKQAEQRFDDIRGILVTCLGEPEHQAFWKAVEGRDAIRSLLASPGPALSPATVERCAKIIEGYADSYRMMANDGDGRVMASSVHTDLLCNILPAVRRALLASPAPRDAEAVEAMDAIDAQLNEMRSLKGWRLNLIRENMGKLRAAICASIPVTSTKSTSEDRQPNETGDEYEARIGKLVVGRPVTSNNRTSDV